MSFDARVYQVLIASPSDVGTERVVAERVLHEWNSQNSKKRGVALLPLRWETHVAPEYKVRPQEAVNRAIVDHCDMVVAIFWTRIGSPTGVESGGTLEEIERASKANKRVMLYFSHVPIDPDKLDCSQLQALREFRERIKNDAFPDTFESPAEFEDKFSRHLESALEDMINRDRESPSK